MNKLHDRIIEGDGSREAPFVIHTSNYILSAQIQNEIVDRVFGAGAWTPQQRRYSSSKRGERGNEDMCEHLVTVGGRLTSVWFDLYLVTKLVNDPGLNEAKRNLMASPAGQKVTALVRDALFKPPPATLPPPQPPPKQNTIAKAMFGLFKPKKKKPLEVLFEEKTIYVNADSFNKGNPFSNIVRVIGQNTTVDLTGFTLMQFLAHAMMQGWIGADGLFQRLPNGKTSLKLHEEQAVTSSEALDLVRVLTNSPLGKQDAENPFLETLTPLVAIAASGGFTMQLI